MIAAILGALFFTAAAILAMAVIGQSVRQNAATAKQLLTDYRQLKDAVPARQITIRTMATGHALGTTKQSLAAYAKSPNANGVNANMAASYRTKANIGYSARRVTSVMQRAAA